jgi:hypothetical protein
MTVRAQRGLHAEVNTHLTLMQRTEPLGQRAVESKLERRPLLQQMRWTMLCSCLLMPGCARFAHREGWFLTGADGMVSKALPVPNLDHSAIALRDAHTNALAITAGPPSVDSLQTSWLGATRSVQITFHTELSLPTEAPRVFFPIASSPHVRPSAATELTSRKDLEVRFSVDELGYDLLLSTFFSPRGLQGVAAFTSLPLTLPLEARADQPWFVFASLWSDANNRHLKELLFRGEVEYPVILDTLSFRVGQTAVSIPISRTLKPWKTVKLKLPVRWSAVDETSIVLTKRVERTVPTVLTIKARRIP